LVENRQLLQDAILGRVVDSARRTSSSEEEDEEEAASAAAEGDAAIAKPRKRPWIVFTAGPMGVGKGYVLTKLHRAGVFPAGAFLKIDPDMIKGELPEMAGYLRANRDTAATKLHRESTQMADVLFEHALQRNMPVLVDGSLRDVAWYRQLFDRIHGDFPDYRIAIVHVTADRGVVHRRAADRAEKSGRAVPAELIDRSIEQVPESVRALSKLADAVYTIANNDGKPLELVSTTAEDVKSWEDFAAQWERQDGDEATKETCAAPSAAAADDHDQSLLLQQTCNVAACWDDAEAHRAARLVWGAAYPNFCARCCLTCDCQCGICIHGKHSCACHVCRGEEKKAS
jgi:hypothetical protein